MKRSKTERRFTGQTEVMDGNVLVNNLIMERMPASYALTTHFDNLIATYGTEAVENFIMMRFGMKRKKSQNKAA